MSLTKKQTPKVQKQTGYPDRQHLEFLTFAGRYFIVTIQQAGEAKTF
jgi:hypothetical protein